jgi:polyvinyl alcohol dehydrogenase (cytochrome)
MSHRRPVVRVLVALMMTLALTLVARQYISADAEHGHPEWLMNGHDVANSRSQPSEHRIASRNVNQLSPRWTLTTTGDVSATPAVSRESEKPGNGRGHSDLFLYFPDWGKAPQGGTLWKVNAETGAVVWSHLISEYNGITGSISRTSPALSHGLVLIGDLNGNMMGIEAETGNLRWITELDPNPNTIVTTSPVVHGDHLYIATSSSGGGAARLAFRGSMIALDILTGKIVWQTFVLPDNGGLAGGAFVNPPAIDVEHGLVFGAAGQLYNTEPQLPATVRDCLNADPDHWDESCFPPGAYFNSVIAFDLRTGKPRWSFRGAGPDARLLGCGDPAPSWCPPWENFSVWDYAGSGVNVFRVGKGKGRNSRLIAGIGQKSGVYWALDAVTGELVWSRLVGHGDDPGGIQWGTAVDDKYIYAAIGHNANPVPYMLKSGLVTSGGSWAALDRATGEIVWQTPDPQAAPDPTRPGSPAYRLGGVPDLAALTVANGVLYAGSMAHSGDQMYALDTSSGEILWRFPAGGSVVAGPAVVDGTVYWGSGYARTGGIGNDQFFAFSLGGR